MSEVEAIRYNRSYREVDAAGNKHLGSDSENKVPEFLKEIASKECTPCDLYDDETGEISMELEKWMGCYTQQLINSYNGGSKEPYITFEDTPLDGLHFEYDSNRNGNFETTMIFLHDDEMYTTNCYIDSEGNSEFEDINISGYTIK